MMRRLVLSRILSTAVALSILFTWLAAPDAQPAAFYVRPGATGSNNGTDWTNAFTSVPSTLQRGATYYLADGNYSGYIFDDPPSGTSYITLRKATAGAHGTNTGWSSSYGDGVAAFTSGWTFRSSYYDIDGVTGGGPQAWSSGHGISVSVGAGGDNIDLTTLGIRGFRFRHIAIINGTSPTSNNNTSGRLFNGHAFTEGQVVNDVLVEYCYAPNFMGVPFHVWWGSDWTIQYSYFAGDGFGGGNGGGEPIHREFWSGVGNDRWTIRWNLIRDMMNSAIIGLVNGGGVSDAVEIYGNIFDYSGGGPTFAAFFIDAGDVNPEPVRPTNWKIYNNTVVGWRDGAPSVNLNTGSNNEFRNNVYANHQTGYGPQFSSVTVTHNAYYNITRFDVGDVTGAWAAIGSNAQIFPSDPFVNYSNADYRPAYASAPGTPLPAPYNVDMFGNVRGVDGTWDRGALEFGGAGSGPPAAPTNLRILPTD